MTKKSQGCGRGVIQLSRVSLKAMIICDWTLLSLYGSTNLSRLSSLYDSSLHSFLVEWHFLCLYQSLCSCSPGCMCITVLLQPVAITEISFDTVQLRCSLSALKLQGIKPRAAWHLLEDDVHYTLWSFTWPSKYLWLSELLFFFSGFSDTQVEVWQSCVVFVKLLEWVFSHPQTT